jgi:glycerol-3-phosphate dehydrogenase
MAEDCVDHAATLAKLDELPCMTKTLNIHGHHQHAEQFGDLSYYGSDATALRELITTAPEFGRQLDPTLPIQAVQVVWGVRHEMARTVDDVLSRRTRALFLNAKAALTMAPAVAKLMATELGRDERWQNEQVAQFTAMAQGYLVRPGRGGQV